MLSFTIYGHLLEKGFLLIQHQINIYFSKVGNTLGVFHHENIELY